jgi:hypothetical protein
VPRCLCHVRCLRNKILHGALYYFLGPLSRKRLNKIEWARGEGFGEFWGKCAVKPVGGMGEPNGRAIKG